MKKNKLFKKFKSGNISFTRYINELIDKQKEPWESKFLNKTSKKYRLAIEKIKELEATVGTKQSLLQKSNTTAIADISNLEDQLENLKEEHEKSANSFNDKIDNLNTDIDELVGENHTLQTKISDLKKSLKKSNEEIKELKSDRYMVVKLPSDKTKGKNPMKLQRGITSSQVKKELKNKGELRNEK